MSQLVAEPLTTPDGITLEACGVLVEPANLVLGMADALARVLSDLDEYERLSTNARTRVKHFFQLHAAMRQYNALYRELGRLPVPVVAGEIAAAA